MSKRVQAVLENKGAQTKYGLSGLLDLHKLSVFALYTVFPFMFALTVFP